MIAGTLEIQLLANVARLSDDMKQAKDIVTSATSSINSAIGTTRQALEALGLGLSINWFAGLIKGAIDAQDQLETLTHSTSLTVEELAGLQLLSAETGTGLDSMAKAIDRMSVSIGKDPGKFAALGVTAKDNAGAFKQLADIFNQVTDVQQRNALAQAVFNRSWAEVAPALSLGSQAIGEILTKGAQLSKVTEDSAKQANAFKTSVAELDVSFRSFTTTLVNNMLPDLLDITKAMKEAATEGAGPLTVAWIGFGGAVAYFLGLTENQKVATRLKEINDQIAVAKAQISSGVLSSGSTSFWSFLIPDAQLTQEAISRLKQTVAALEKEKAQLTGGNKPKASTFDSDFAAQLATQQQVAQKVQDFLRDDYSARVAAIKIGGQAVLDADKAMATSYALQVKSSAVQNERTEEEAIQTAADIHKAEVYDAIATQQKLLAIAQSGSQDKQKVKEAADAQASIARLNQQLVIDAKNTADQITAVRETTAKTNAAQYREWEASQEALGETIADSLMTDQEIEQRNYQQRLNSLRLYLSANAGQIAIADRLIETAEAQHQARMSSTNSLGIKSRFDLNKMTDDERLQYFTQTLTSLTAAGAQHNKELFELNKAAGIANAMVSTYQGAAAALAWGWPLGPIFAAVIIAAGLANIAQIASAKFGDSSSAPSVGGGTAIPVVPVSSDPGSGSGTAPAASPQTTIIHLVGDTFGAKQIRDLVDGINASTTDGGRIKFG